MDLDGQPCGPGRREKPFSLSRREGDALAKRISGIGKAFGNHERKDIATQGFDIAILVVVFGWQCVSAQECRDHIHFAPLRERACCSQLLQFSVNIQAVSGLDFYRRHAVGE